MVVDILYDLYEGLKVAEEFLDTRDGYSIQKSHFQHAEEGQKTSGNERPLVLSRVGQIFFSCKKYNHLFGEKTKPLCSNSTSSQESLQVSG